MNWSGEIENWSGEIESCSGATSSAKVNCSVSMSSAKAIVERGIAPAVIQHQVVQHHPIVPCRPRNRCNCRISLSVHVCIRFNMFGAVSISLFYVIWCRFAYYTQSFFCWIDFVCQFSSILSAVGLDGILSRHQSCSPYLVTHRCKPYVDSWRPHISYFDKTMC